MRIFLMIINILHSSLIFKESLLNKKMTRIMYNSINKNQSYLFSKLKGKVFYT